MLQARPSGSVAICCLVILANSLLVLLGWFFDLPQLKSVIPGLIAMNPVTAIGLGAIALSLWIRGTKDATPVTRNFACVLALAAVLLGAGKVSVYLAGFGPAIDQAVFAGSIGQNRIAFNTALCFVLLGTALVAIDVQAHRRVWPAQLPIVGVASISMLSLIGYAYGAESMYQLTTEAPMALNTAACFLTLAVAMLLSRPDRGIARSLLADGPGGEMARRLLPAIIGIPFLLGWLRLLAQDAGLYDTRFGAALMVAATILLFLLSMGWIANTLNTTEQGRQQANAELQRTSNEVFTLYNSAPCGYHSIDADGHIIAINDTELSWIGLSRDDVISKLSFAELLPPTDRGAFLASFASLKSTGLIKDLELQIRRNDGTYFPVIMNALAAYNAEGHFTYCRATLFDATDRKRAEDAVRQLNEALELRVAERTAELAVANADLLQKNQEIETFVYSVSHDLRSPLVNLQGFSKELAAVCASTRELLAGSNVPETVRKKGLQLVEQDMQLSIRFIQTAVTRLSSIIDALLRLSRVGRIEYRRQPVNVATTVQRIVDALHQSVTEKHATIEVHELPEISGDPAAIEQVFANLLDNALKYSATTRSPHIEVGVVEEDSSVDRQTPNFQTYYVRDNGLGLDAAYLPKLFQAFKRFHPSASPGEGMGLAIIRRIVQRHGGEIRVESTKDVGSTFFITLPVEKRGDNLTAVRQERKDLELCQMSL